MSAQTIVVTIGPTGEVTVGVEGVVGPACQALSRPLEAALGITREDTRTAEYYRTAASNTRHVRLDSA